MNQGRQTGFTLIELSIVLVIIGLVVGGIIFGEDLIHAAQLRSVISDVGKYSTAVNTFKTKYGSLPGDMPDATSYWGADASCPLTPSNTTPKTKTCNGNGNGLIGDSSASMTYYEEYRAWQQLANAGLIPGIYTGTPTGTPNGEYSTVGVNVPASRIAKGGYEMYYFASGFGPNRNALSICRHHVIHFAASNSFNQLLGPILNSQDAFTLDSKIDDGQPGSGKIIAEEMWYPGGWGCVVDWTSLTTTYNTTNSGVICGLTFGADF